MALSPLTAYYRIGVDIFRLIMDNNPQLTMSVISMIGLKLQTENQLESLIFKDARGKDHRLHCGKCSAMRTTGRNRNIVKTFPYPAGYRQLYRHKPANCYRSSQ